MSYEEESELLNLTRENNVMLKVILKHLSLNLENEFSINLIANLVSNYMTCNRSR